MADRREITPDPTCLGSLGGTEPASEAGQASAAGPEAIRGAQTRVRCDEAAQHGSDRGGESTPLSAASPCSTAELVTPAELVSQHLSGVYAYAYRLCRSPSEAEELTQQVFLTAQQRLHQLRDVDRARSWLLTITRNAFLKSQAGRKPSSATDLELDLGTVCADPESEIAEGPFDSERLQLALSQLPEHYRNVVLMFYFEELTYQQIAEALELPIGTVMSRLSRGKQMLKSALTQVAVLD